MELFEELFLLLLNVLVLLEAHFVLPLEVLVLLLRLNDPALPVGQLLAHLVVQHLLLEEHGDLLFHVLERFHNLVVIGVLSLLITSSRCLTDFLSLEVGAECADHVHVECCDVMVVVMNVLILLVVLRLQFLDSAVLLSLNLCDLRLALCFHFLTQARHFCLVLLLNLVGDALELLALASSLGIEVLVERVLVLGLTHLLLLLLDLERAQVLFQFALINAVLILGVL